jgi:hypothetical protein
MKYRSEQSRGLKLELSSLTRTLGSWVRIPLEAWMSEFFYSVCVVLCVAMGFVMGCSPFQGVLPTVYKIEKLKSDQGPTKGP